MATALLAELLVTQGLLAADSEAALDAEETLTHERTTRREMEANSSRRGSIEPAPPSKSPGGSVLTVDLAERLLAAGVGVCRSSGEAGAARSKELAAAKQMAKR